MRISSDLELADADNDFDLDVLVSCKRCAGRLLWLNDAAGNEACAEIDLPPG